MAITAEVTDVLITVAAISAPIAEVPIQVALVPASFADILTALLARGVVPDLSRVLAQLATILPNFMGVAAKLARVMMDVTPVRTELAGLAMRYARMQRRVRVIDSLCAHELRTSNEQGCGNGSHSEIAHGISQRQDRALAAMACAAYTTVARPPTLRANLGHLEAASFSGQSFRVRAHRLGRGDRTHARR